MSIKKMEYDNWINSLSNDTEIENPTWEQVCSVYGILN